ncbi:MAG: hypothetical protein ACK5R0_16025 [Bacteroidota bacterium]|jgi:hypothetical protein
MKYGLLIILMLLTIVPSIGQDISKIVLSSQGFDEPPTKQGKPLLTVEYVKDDSGNYTATHYYENKKKRKLGTPITIEKERIKIIEEWKANNLKRFQLSDLGLNDELIRKRAKDKDLKTTFGLPDNLLLETDSFSLCQRLKMTKSHSTGGHRLKVSIDFVNGETDIFEFGSNDLGMGLFNLRGYFYSYKLLLDRIPNQVHQYGFFTLDNLTDLVLTYFKIVECEGYFYNEFTDKNPNRTPQENRMMTGWDFFEYMRQRSKKE